MLRRIMAVAVLCGLALVPAIGQQKKAAKSYVLKAARMFDGRSSSLVAPGVVIVTDGKIAGVGAGASVPEDAEVIDLGDATLLPGFIDAHTHLTMMYSEDYSKAALDALRKPIPEMALDASVNARITLMAGFTTVRDVGSAEYLDAGLRNRPRSRRRQRTRRSAARGSPRSQIRRDGHQDVRHGRSAFARRRGGHSAIDASRTRRPG